MPSTRRRAPSFPSADQSLAESLASQAAIALTNRLLSQLERLFESFVKLINLAIDEKSPYTGGHCQRVPELTMMLAEAAHATHQGAAGRFSHDRARPLRAQDGRPAARLRQDHHAGACGGQGHQAANLYDRIGLIDTRFEVLKRDAELAALRRQLALRPVAMLRRGQHPAGAAARADGAGRRPRFLRAVNQGWRR
jgi:hypothetical protein